MMKNKGFLGLLIALFVAILFYFLLKSDKKSTINKEETEFAVKDTAAIGSVTITGYLDGKMVGKVYLTKKGNQWWVNEEFKAQNVAVENLLKTIYAIQMRQPLHPNAIENVKKLIKKRNVHVIIKNQTGKVLKGYYLGPATPDTKGNYVILEGAENPYIAEIPGFEGYLSTRFSANPDVWKDYTLWNFSSDDFHHFELKDKKQKSIVYILRKKGSYILNNQVFADSTFLKKMAKNYLKCVATGPAKPTFPNAQDSLTKIPAEFTLKVNDKEYLLWSNPYGAYFIVSVKTDEQKRKFFDGEVMLLQKLTVQRWFMSNTKTEL
jgi:hypothetical protein